MSEQRYALTAGKPVMFSTGCYSAYNILGVFLPLQDVSKEQMDEVAEVTAGGSWNADQRFLAELIRRGWVLEIEVRQVHLGDYPDKRVDLS